MKIRMKIRRSNLKYIRNYYKKKSIYLKKEIMDEIIDEIFYNNQQEIDIDSSYHMKYICDDRCFGF
jgi:hypothetical protein